MESIVLITGIYKKLKKIKYLLNWLTKMLLSYPSRLEKFCLFNELGGSLWTFQSYTLESTDRNTDFHLKIK